MEKRKNTEKYSTPFHQIMASHIIILNLKRTHCAERLFFHRCARRKLLEQQINFLRRQFEQFCLLRFSAVLNSAYKLPLT